MIEHILQPMTLNIAVAVGFILACGFLIGCFISRKFSVSTIITLSSFIFVIGTILTMSFAVIFFGMKDVSEVFERKFLN